MSKRDKKKDKGTAHRLSNQIRAQHMMLAHAFVVARRDGFKLRVTKIDGHQVDAAIPTNPHLNVEVVRGAVSRCWIG